MLSDSVMPGAGGNCPPGYFLNSSTSLCDSFLLNPSAAALTGLSWPTWLLFGLGVGVGAVLAKRHAQAKRR